MDFSGYTEFPFPTKLNSEEEKLKEYFFSLSDEEQYSILKNSKSYSSFCTKLYDALE